MNFEVPISSSIGTNLSSETIIGLVISLRSANITWNMGWQLRFVGAKFFEQFFKRYIRVRIGPEGRLTYLLQQTQKCWIPKDRLATRAGNKKANQILPLAQTAS